MANYICFRLWYIDWYTVYGFYSVIISFFFCFKWNCFLLYVHIESAIYLFNNRMVSVIWVYWAYCTWIKCIFCGVLMTILFSIHFPHLNQFSIGLFQSAHWLYERKANELSIIGGNIHTYSHIRICDQSPVPGTLRAMLIYEEMDENSETKTKWHWEN